MSNLRCPRCATVVAPAPGQPPVCPTCGFGAPATAAAPAAAEWGPPASQTPLPQGQLPYPPAHYGYAPTKTDGMAIASLVCGICCIFYVVAIILGPLAIAFGAIALRRIKANPMLGGRGMAIAGIVIGSIFLAIALVVILSAVVFVLVQNGSA